MYRISYTTRMRKDIQRVKRCGKDISKLVAILDLLKTGEPLPETYRLLSSSQLLRPFKESDVVRHKTLCTESSCENITVSERDLDNYYSLYEVTL